MSALSEHQLFKRIKLLGQGSFGKAFLVESLKDHLFYVIKQMDLTRMNEAEKKEMIREAKILEALTHPNIICFREVYRTKKGKLCIVMDYAEGGDLAKKITEMQRKNQLFTETQILDWFTQICLALKHVHDRKILHRDIKNQNIFLTKDNMIKLGDFGIARILSSTREKAKTMVGTPYYLSPEIIENKPYNFSSDVWSLGVVLYEMCSLKPPFNAENLKYLGLKIIKGIYNPIPAQYSKDLRKLIDGLLKKDANQRPTVNDILKMPIIINRIRNFLSETMRNHEFSHTVLHQQIFVNQKVNLNEIKNVNEEEVKEVNKFAINQAKINPKISNHLAKQDKKEPTKPLKPQIEDPKVILRQQNAENFVNQQKPKALQIIANPIIPIKNQINPINPIKNQINPIKNHINPIKNQIIPINPKKNQMNPLKNQINRPASAQQSPMNKIEKKNIDFNIKNPSTPSNNKKPIQKRVLSNDPRNNEKKEPIPKIKNPIINKKKDNLMKKPPIPPVRLQENKPVPVKIKENIQEKPKEIKREIKREEKQEEKKEIEKIFPRKVSKEKKPIENKQASRPKTEISEKLIAKPIELPRPQSEDKRKEALMKPPLFKPIKDLEVEINPEMVIKNKASFVQMVSELENLITDLNSKVENLELNQNNQKKGIPSFDAKNFDCTEFPVITFMKLNNEKFEEREDDPQEFEESNKKNEDLFAKVLEEEDLIYLKDKRKLEVLYKGNLCEFIFEFKSLLVSLRGEMGGDYEKTYEILRGKLEIYGLDILEEKFGKDNYQTLLPHLNVLQIEKYVPMIVTYILMKDEKK